LCDGVQNWAVCAGLTTGRPYEKLFYNHEFKLYDRNGDYVRLWVTELQELPTEFLVEPWKMSDAQQIEFNVRIGIDYPYRIVLPRLKSLKHRDENDELLKKEMKLRGMKVRK
jgi:deoxyribodipyrimidine photo-lyase